MQLDFEYSRTEHATCLSLVQVDVWSGIADHTGMADHSSPDYELAETLRFDSPAQFKALFDETRSQIIDLLSERAATIKELADTLEKPKGTIGHHVGALADAGLIRVVRTKKVRAIEAKYYGRTARTFLLDPLVKDDVVLAPGFFLTAAAAEYADPPTDAIDALSTLRYARIPETKAAEWADRLVELSEEFIAESRAGETTYGLVIGFYPTDRSHLPDLESS